MSIIGYKLLIAGIPYDLLTGPAMTIAAGDPGDFGTETGVVQAPHYLDWPDLQFTVAAKPLDGDLEVDPIEVLVHDARIESGIASGYPIMSWLGGRDPVSLTSAAIVADISPGDTTIYVNTAGFPSSGFVWIEQEAIYYTGKTIASLTGCTRGALGTIDAAHTTDYLSGRTPEVFTAPPWIFQRRATLWAIDDQGKGGITSRRIYSGVIRVPPALADDGARWSLRLEHLWGAIKDAQPTREYGRVELTGCSAQATTGNVSDIAFASLFRYRAIVATDVGWTLAEGPAGTWQTLEAAATAWASRLRDWIDNAFGLTAGSARMPEVRRNGRELQLTVEYKSSNAPSGPPVAYIAGQPPMEAAGNPRRRDYGGNAYWQSIHVWPDAPYVLHVLALGRLNTIPIRHAFGVPSGYWAATLTVDDGRTVSIAYNLRVPYDDDYFVDLTNVTLDTTTLTAIPVYTPRKRPPSYTGLFSDCTLRDPPPAQVILNVNADHWFDGIKLLSNVLTEATANDWDFSNYFTVIFGTAGMHSRRVWSFSGEERLGDALVEACQLTGCTPTVIEGRVGFIDWSLIPGGIVVSDASTFGPTSIVGNSPHWEGWTEGLANRYRLVRGDDLTILVTDARSLNRYGQGREITVELKGVEGFRLENIDPQSLYRQMLSGMARYSEPIAVVRIQGPSSRQLDFELGFVIRVQNDWRVPDGTGGRGLTDAYGRIVKITYDTGIGEERVFVMDVLIFSRRSRAYGPSARVSSRTGTTQLNLTNAAVNGGSFSGTGSDDAQQFAAGDEIEIVVRGTRGTERMTNTVASVGTATITIGTALTSAMQYWIDNAAALGVKVEVRLRDYSASTATQKEKWAWVGAEITSVIDGTADPLHRFAP